MKINYKDTKHEEENIIKNISIAFENNVTQLHRAEKPTNCNLKKQHSPTPAVPISVALGPLSNQQKTFDNAMSIVKAFPPNRPNILNWPNYTSESGIDKLDIVIFTADQAKQSPILSEIIQSGNADAFTYLKKTKNDQNNTDTKLYLGLIYDRLFFDQTGKPYPDSFVRLTVSLAHELYGNVDQHLNNNAGDDQQEDTPQKRIDGEIKAFTESVAFIERVINSKIFANMPSNIQTDFKNALQREKKLLQAWQTRK